MKWLSERERKREEEDRSITASRYHEGIVRICPRERDASTKRPSLYLDDEFITLYNYEWIPVRIAGEIPPLRPDGI